MKKKRNVILFLGSLGLGCITSCGSFSDQVDSNAGGAKLLKLGVSENSRVDAAALDALAALDEPVVGRVSKPERGEVSALGADFFEEDLLDGGGEVYDPLEKVNRVIFAFNDKLYVWVLHPVNNGYRWLMPDFAETGLSHFYTNLRAPVRVVNSLLQGDVQGGLDETGVFLCNTIFGLGGLIQLEAGQAEHQEDLGQTLGKWGIGSGPYLVLPVIGPSSLRHAVGRVGDSYAFPPTYIDDTGARVAVIALERVNDLEVILGRYDTLIAASIEPYEALRQVYSEFRRKQVAE